MSANERIRGIQVHRPVIYGSHARWLTEEEKALAPVGHTHKWTIFFTSATSPPPIKGSENVEDLDYIPGGEDDLSYLIKKVTFRLHETYPNPNRVCDRPPYRVSETGWGEFTVQIRIQFVPESLEKPLTLNHPIKLHHWGAPIEGAEPSLAAGQLGGGTASTVPSSAPTPVPISVDGEKKEEIDPKDGTEQVKHEPTTASTPAAVPTSVEGAPVPSTEMVVEPTQTSETEPNTETQEADSHMVVGGEQATANMISRIPVHAWQYDELIFADPPRAFLDILNEHPPTPLPYKNRRPRDQREEHERKTNPKKKRASLAPTSSIRGSRANTESGTPAPPATAPPPPGQGVGVGNPGEPGSADVPLEFSGEMEKGEWNRLAEARVKIVEQMDRWRERLIAQEKELAKLKDEVKAM